VEEEVSYLLFTERQHGLALLRPVQEREEVIMLTQEVMELMAQHILNPYNNYL
jgi:hypothetical protein